MRVFLSGAQGVGKSTVVMNFPEGLKKKDSFSREFLLGNPSAQRSGSEGNKEFQDKILLYCLSIYLNEDKFISSRSIIDSYAYLAVGGGDTKPLVSILDYYQPYLFTPDDLYVYIPIEFELTNRGNSIRDTDLEYQRKVDQSIRENFELFQHWTDANFIELRGTQEERISQLITKIKEVENV